MHAASHHRWRKLLAGACAIGCCWLAWYAVRAGASRLLAESASGLAGTEYEAAALPLAGESLRLNSSDPEAHYALAVASAQSGDDRAAVASLERAVALRPLYYLTWLKLGRARERAGDTDGALAAVRESIRLAPFYAEPRWQLGNTQLRAGNLEAAFAELRRAASSRPALFAYTAELAWHAYDGDAQSVVRACAPHNSLELVALARFLVKHDEGAEALKLYRDGRADVDAEARRALVADMIVAGKFREAYEVWADGKRAGDAKGDAAAVESARDGAIFNGGFESPAGRDEPGFDWRFAREQQAVSISLDQASPHNGTRSLLFVFDGAPGIALRFASQLVLVEPGARYRLNFAARTENLVSGGTPLVSLMNAAGDKLLAQTDALPRNTGGWREYTIEFDAPDEAVLLVIRRAGCAEATCPIFGRVWFDDFSLKKL
ncbi:MAG: hypothetical protein LC754_14150 [Acidobacteria bacterium]|nr:hypothetical protein [Acidobacteriota bacterium]